MEENQITFNLIDNGDSIMVQSDMETFGDDTISTDEKLAIIRYLTKRVLTDFLIDDDFEEYLDCKSQDELNEFIEDYGGEKAVLELLNSKLPSFTDASGKLLTVVIDIINFVKGMLTAETPQKCGFSLCVYEAVAKSGTELYQIIEKNGKKVAVRLGDEAKSIYHPSYSIHSPDMPQEEASAEFLKDICKDLMLNGVDKKDLKKSTRELMKEMGNDICSFIDEFDPNDYIG